MSRAMIDLQKLVGGGPGSAATRTRRRQSVAAPAPDKAGEEGRAKLLDMAG
jgi:phosphatidylglycerol lysyltransferase